MKIQLVSGKSKQPNCLLLAVGKNWKFLGQKIGAQHEKTLKDFLKNGLLEDKHGASLFIPNLGKQNYLVVYCDKTLNREHYSKFLKKAYAALKATRVTSVLSHLNELAVEGADEAWALQKNATTAFHTFYNFDKFRSKKSLIHSIKTIEFKSSEKKALARALALNNSYKIVKDLANTPANVCTPSHIAKTAKSLGTNQAKVKVSVFGEAQMKKMGMNTILAVGQASSEESKFITVEYEGGKASEKPYVFLGKGISYDTGGYSLKPPMSMLGMQYDMCGAATVIGLMDYLIATKAPVNVVGIIASAENMIGGDGYKPNDVITSYSGKTIEVLNTDAEGRLVMCDALTYAEKFKPKAVISMATLTGGVLVALGQTASAVMGYQQNLVDEILDAADKAFDRCWQLPLYEEFNEGLKSKVADMANISGDRFAQTAVAACFLGRFTEKYDWAHLDIAGTANNNKEMATGRPLGALVQFIEDKIKR